MNCGLPITIGLNIFEKEKNNTLHLPLITPLSFFYAKDVCLVKLSGEVLY